ncbi:MAG TPA: DUF3455 domain-containing protein [Polyangiaceae bacterium]|jgi:hypothetical protein|nr:DUF3455 domain-containing protein [Polyangiaceae bacterium]
MFRALGSCLVLLASVGCQGAVAEAPAKCQPLNASSPASVAPLASQSATAPAIPPELAVPEGAQLLLKARGKGAQIYVCAPKPDDANAFDWKLKAPDADLFDDQGAKVAHHFAGPTWQANDGSSVVGNLVKKLDAPDAQAIPWLLLVSKETKGPGFFEHVTHIQRVATSGGKAPALGCDVSHLNAEVSVPYEASYYFYASSGTSPSSKPD